MTLTTHAIAGAAVASFTPQNPALGFCAGFASHFVLDAIPHYDYPLFSGIKPEHNAKIRANAALWHDLFFIALDILAGLCFGFLFFAASGSYWAIFWGAVGGMLPDILNGVWSQWRHEPFTSLRDFHMYMHARRRFEKEGRLGLGIVSQIALVIVIFGLGLYLHSLAG